MAPGKGFHLKVVVYSFQIVSLCQYCFGCGFIATNLVFSIVATYCPINQYVLIFSENMNRGNPSIKISSQCPGYCFVRGH